jgi:hypothetical protein
MVVMAELSDLAEAVTQGIRRMAERDRKHRRAVFLVIKVGVKRIHRRPQPIPEPIN